MISAVYESEIDARFPPADPQLAAELRSSRLEGSFSMQSVGTFVLTLNSSHKVSLIEIMYRTKLEKM
jgi:hypothetical protein